MRIRQTAFVLVSLFALQCICTTGMADQDDVWSREQLTHTRTRIGYDINIKTV